MYTYMFVKVFTKKTTLQNQETNFMCDKIVGEMLFTNGVRKIR